MNLNLQTKTKDRDYVNLPKYQRVKLPKNEKTMMQQVEIFKNYLNKHHKLIGYEKQSNKNVYNAAIDDNVTFKFLCDKDCRCEHIFDEFRHFTLKNEIFMEHGKFSLNGHLLYHQFKLYIK